MLNRFRVDKEMNNSGVVVVVGSGGREHALARRLRNEPAVTEVHAWPGNAGMAKDGIICHGAGSVMDFAGIGALALATKAEMVVVGPEGPLVEGIANYFAEDNGLRDVMLVGPSKEGARLEGSKSFAKAFMQRHGIPTARYESFDASQAEEALRFLRTMRAPYVIKADGLAAGKGVAICQTLGEAEEMLRSYFDGKFAEASSRVVIEEFLSGIEVSVFIVTDGEGNYVLLPEAKDYKRLGEGDKGPNTGGMGSVSPVPFADDSFMESVVTRIVKPTLDGLREENIDYKGFIFFGLIRLEDGSPYVIEYNARMGDPETQAVLPRLDESLFEIFRAMRCGALGQRKAKCTHDACVSVTLAAAGYPEAPRKGMRIDVDDANVPANGHVIYSGVTSKEGGVLYVNGGRVISACGAGATIEAAAACAYRTAEAVNFDGKYMRRDVTQDVI